jgi:hypothetical protein
MYLCKFSRNSRKNLLGGNSLVVKKCFALLVDDSSTMIASNPAMFNQDKYWVVWGVGGGLRLIGCIFMSSQAISTRIGVEAIA